MALVMMMLKKKIADEREIVVQFTPTIITRRANQTIKCLVLETKLTAKQNWFKKFQKRHSMTRS